MGRFHAWRPPRIPRTEGRVADLLLADKRRFREYVDKDNYDLIAGWGEGLVVCEEYRVRGRTSGGSHFIGWGTFIAWQNLHQVLRYMDADEVRRAPPTGRRVAALDRKQIPQ